jgi:DNA polymerase-3 subunit alpha
VFQLESDGMTELLKRMRPDRFEDLIAILALYRPGPLGSGMVESYVKRKHGEEPIAYLHPKLEPILKETLGVILYQEQVMRIANVLSGFSLNEADALRKAMGKKKPEILARYEEQFRTGAEKNGVPGRIATEIFDQIKFFAGYGFNKSHSAAYALITFQTAWLKAHHPLEYMAAQLTCEMSWIEKTVASVDEMKAMGLKLLPPDINQSVAGFAVQGDSIRYGLAAIKGVGQAHVEALVAARSAGGAFRSIFDLCERLGSQALNKGVLEVLVGAGAMDVLPGNRAQKLAVLEDALAQGASAERDRKSGQISLFGAIEEGASSDGRGEAMPALDELPDEVRLQREKDALGFYLTGHPLNRVQAQIRRWTTCEIRRLEGMTDRAPVTIGGIIRAVRTRAPKNGASGSKMAVVEIEDMSGVTEVVIAPKLYLELADRLEADRIVFVKGEVSWWKERPNVRLASLIDFADAPTILSSRVVVRLDGGDELEGHLAAVKEAIRGHRGAAPVVVELVTPQFGTVQVAAGDDYRVKITPALIEKLERVLGTDRVAVS